MRTALTIDDDVLAVAKEMAAIEKKSTGAVTSLLVRKALRPKRSGRKTRNGILLLPIQPDAFPVSSELVTHLMEELF